MVAQRHDLYDVEFDYTVTDKYIHGITQMDINTATETRSEASSGAVHPSQLSLTAQKPTASFTTVAVAAALDVVGQTGMAIETDTPSGPENGLNLYAHKHALGGTRAGATSHRKYNIKNCMVVPRTLSAAHQQDATLSYDVLIFADATNDPIIVTDSVTLPDVVTDDERFTLGTIQIGGVTIENYRNLDIDFGITATTEGAQSDYWDTHASISVIQPVITIRGIQVEWLKSSNIPLLGKAATHANTTIYLRKYLLGGTFELDASAVHVKITAAGLAYVSQPFSVGGDTPAEVEITMPLYHDGTNNPMVIDTASAIA